MISTFKQTEGLRLSLWWGLCLIQDTKWQGRKKICYFLMPSDLNRSSSRNTHPHTASWRLNWGLHICIREIIQSTTSKTTLFAYQTNLRPLQRYCTFLKGKAISPLGKAWWHSLNVMTMKTNFKIHCRDSHCSELQNTDHKLLLLQRSTILSYSLVRAPILRDMTVTINLHKQKNLKDIFPETLPRTIHWISDCPEKT